MTRIKDLPLNERPREKAYYYGIQSLSNVELLAVLLSFGSKNNSALDIGYEILKRYGSIQAIANLSIDELLSINGVSLAKGIRLSACFELIRRFEKEIKTTKTYIKSTDEVLDLIIPRCINLTHEEFYLVYMTKQNQLIRVETLYVGTKNNLTLSSEDIVKAILKANASKVYIAHNHPSDSVKPSKLDLDSFNALSFFLATCSIELVDSLIICNNESYSCKEEKTYVNKRIIE